MRAGAQEAAAGGTLDAADVARLSQAEGLLQRYGGETWPGCGPQPLLVRDGERDLLVGHPTPPRRFERLEGDTVAGLDGYGRWGHLVPVPAAPALTGVARWFSGGASGHTHRGLYAQLAWHATLKSSARCPFSFSEIGVLERLEQVATAAARLAARGGVAEREQRATAAVDQAVEGEPLRPPVKSRAVTYLAETRSRSSASWSS